jgi:uncharacterized membrane protein YphA (DoxX/SURF4 family)
MTAVPVLATLLVLAFAVTGTQKILAVPAMVGRAEHLGFTATSYRYLGVLEVLGAVGLVLGAFLPWLGIAAAVGLLLMMGGAVVAHVRGGDGRRELVPAVAVGLAVLAYLALMVTHYR